jgi:hypothetical protein
MAEGFWIVPVVLALYFVEKKLAGRARRAALALAMALMLPAAVIFVSWAVSNSRTPAAPAFLPVEEVRAFEWMDANAQADSIVLSGYNAGNALPAFAGLVSFIGHGPETLNSAQKMILVQTVFDGTRPEAERLAALRQTGARYVLVGPEERARMGSDIPACRVVYREDGWEVWEIILTE